MCHLILALPFVSLLLFYFLPFTKALMIYVPILFLSLFIYFKIMKAMMLSPKTGREEMLGKGVEIIEPLAPEGKVRVMDEIWNARLKDPKDALEEGEKGRIVAFDGLTLIIERIQTNQNSSLKSKG